MQKGFGLSHYYGEDRETSQVLCDRCGEMICFVTDYRGQLLAVNGSDRERHRHQPHASSPEENRKRIERMREVEAR